ARGTSLVPYQAQLGIEFVEGAEGYAKLRLPYTKQNSTVGDALHGGAISSLTDTTGAMPPSTTADLGNTRYFASTVGATVNSLPSRPTSSFPGPQFPVRSSHDLRHSPRRPTRLRRAPRAVRAPLAKHAGNRRAQHLQGHGPQPAAPPRLVAHGDAPSRRWPHPP